MVRHDYFGLAIGVVNYHPHELDVATSDTQLNGAESSIPDADRDVIVIHSPVNVRDTQPHPTAALRVEGRHGRYH
jgi:hypothetical protein